MSRDVRRERGRIGGLRALAPRLGLAWRALLLAGIALVAMPFGSAAAPTSSKGEFGFGAFAYGTQAVVANVLRSGPTAAVGLGGGCMTNVGVTNRNTTASLNLGRVARSGTISTLAASRKTKLGVAATSSAATQGVSLLNGLIRVDAVKAVSTTSHVDSTGTFKLSSAGTKLVGLVVNGHHITATPKPNTKVSLPGIGYVVLNQQAGGAAAKAAGLTVTAIHVVVTLGSKHAPAGTQLFVSVANSSLSGPAKGMLVGGAFGTAANVANAIVLGPSFPVGLACLGTDGKTVSNGAAGIRLPHLATSGTITNTANGLVSSTRVYGKTTSTLQSLNVLSGLVTAKAVRAAVSARGKAPTLGDTSSFVGLKVQGHPLVNGKVGPNTHLTIKGIGTLWLHRQIKTKRSITVVMVQLVINTAHNPLHLKLGAIVDVGYASVGIT